jgi:hypothetical protein
VEYSELAGRFVELVSPHLPGDVWIEATDDMLWYHSTRWEGYSGSYFRTFWDAFGDDANSVDRACCACKIALEQLQDFVVENTYSHSWPEGRRPPEHHADVEGDTVHLWFGDQGGPVYEIGYIETA